ncbi:MAG: hypothetical protein A2293_10925 [Elusimicrobia bacterium RIFOXYB2_FULL_49_7]|nr:MAG: hypothetical protein A2293_10925 [Elusimicrobia bacterium RIFOXYB2_FULL_49_7]
MKTILAFFLMTLLFGTTVSEDLVKVSEHILDNGLKILIVEDHHTPLAVCRLYYKVGSVNEIPGKTGLSHMLEHMMFKGTKRIGVSDYDKERLIAHSIDSLFALYDRFRDSHDTVGMKKVRQEAAVLSDKQRQYLKNNELWSLYQREGGTALNAYTADYMTAYIVTLPSNKIELFFWLESDRMANPVLREFYTERDVVMEERRLRYENSPYGRYNETLGSLVFESHPLRNPTIGFMSDVMHLSREDALHHFKTYYVPDNAVLVLVGDVQEQNVLHLAKRYFGPVPAGHSPVPQVTVQEPDQVGEKRLQVHKNVGAVLDLLIKTPELGESDVYALDIIEGVLNGASGRLYKSLVQDKKLCTDISAGNYVSKYYGLFTIHAELKQGADHQAVEQAIFDELDKLKREKIGLRELEKVKNRVTAAEINGLRENEHLADRLAYFEIIRSWKLINTYTDAVKAVTRETVLKTAQHYFEKRYCTLGWMVQDKEGGSK